MTREEAIQRLYRMGRSHVGIIDENTSADNKALSMAIEALSSAEPKTGEWIEEIAGNGWNEWMNLTCNQCGSKFERAGAWLYCPHCGSRNER